MIKKLALVALLGGWVILHGPNGTTQGYIDTDVGTIMLHGPQGTTQGLIMPDGSVMLHNNEGTTIGSTLGDRNSVPAYDRYHFKSMHEWIDRD